MDADAIYRVLTTGTPGERQALVRALPPSRFKTDALALIDPASPVTLVIALGMLTTEYCFGSAPADGAPLAHALHRCAVELSRTPAGRILIPTTLSGYANAFLKASNLLGHSAEVLAFADEWIPFYERLPEPINLRSMKLERIAALLNVGRVDDAVKALEDPGLPGNPVTDIELTRLRTRVAQLTSAITTDRGSARPARVTDAEFAALAGAALRQVSEAMPNDTMRALIDRMVEPSTNDPAGLARQFEALRMGEQFLEGTGQGGSELTMRRRIREASGIFALQKNPAPAQLRAALAELEAGLAWARENGVVELQNDALWGIYLCHSRLKQPSEGADALIALRGNLEAARRGITDVVKRGGAFALYPYLFPALCEKLHAAGRVPELLEAIEASKGRGVADLLTRHAGKAVDDASVYAPSKRLPELCRRHGFSYLTYFVDDERTYAVLVAPDGSLHVAEPVALSREAIRAAAGHPAASEELAGLVAWLSPLLDDGILERGGHLCVAPDDDLANVPFASLTLGGRPLADLFSTSRIHSAFHLEHLLGDDAHRPARYLGVVVPTRQNVASQTWARMYAALEEPIEYLETLLPGDALEGETASPGALLGQPLSDRVVHFSTHGIFSGDAAPFDNSGLILADGQALPDADAIDLDDVLTPRRIFDDGASLKGSHVSLMACVSGLSREGVGGDALGTEWAMIQAGAASVLSSHWNVAAGPAALFLRTFYEHWLGAGVSRAQAMTQTITAMRARGGAAAATEAWSAFSLTGDWR